MKRKLIFSILIGVFIISALSGCNLVKLAAQLESVEDTVDSRIDHVEDQLETALHQPKQDVPKPAPSNSPETSSVELTADQAKSIALEHAGYSADQVTKLYAERDIDDGIPLYEVQFYANHLEYDYDIHADSGKILSYDVDD